MSEPGLAVATPAGARRRLRPAVPDALAVALVGLALLLLWELASWAYLTATVPPGGVNFTAFERRFQRI